MTYGKAPYNFIPLSKNPKTVNKDTVKKHNIQKKGNYTGYLEYKVTTKSPTFIGSTVDEKQDDFDVVQPFTIHGKPAIPGSSFRGMIAQLMEILSKSPLKEYADNELNYRSVFRNIGGYRSKFKNVKKGLLYKKDGKIYIQSLGEIEHDEPNNIEEIKNEFTFESDGNRILWRTGKINKQDLGTAGVGVYEFSFDNLEDRIEVPKNVFNQLIYDEVEYKTDAHKIEYTEVDGINRRKKSYIEWIDYYSKNSHVNEIKGIPVFYTIVKGKIFSIGHTKYHRIPHKNSIGDTLPTGHKNIDEEAIGMVESMMGNKEDFASRLRFTDATMTPGEDNPYLEQGIMKKLMNPKPTAFPFYLKQDKTDPKNQTNYSSSDAELRGRKMYWNKNNVDWKDNKRNAEHKFQKKIKPIKKGVEFTGKIHFNNLTKKELGLLLFALKLDGKEGDMFHRIGMGKSYGMGLIKVSKVKYKRFKSGKRYKNPGKKFLHGKASAKTDQYVKYFLNKQWDIECPQQFFDQELPQLKAILNAAPSNDDNWDEQHSYIGFDNIDEFEAPLIPL